MLLQIRVTLQYIEPKIWRRILIDAERPLEDLHWVIQIGFGWEDSHLYLFEKDGKKYEIPSLEDDSFGESNSEDASSFQIKNMLSKQGDQLIYEYDFGDGWRHEVVVESIDSEMGMYEPMLIAGERNGPPEDCGGPPGFAALVDAMANKKHPERRNLVEWLGYAYNPETFDPSMINMEMRENFED